MGNGGFEALRLYAPSNYRHDIANEISWVIVDSRAGLQNVRAIAAGPGIGVLWPGAGPLRQVFSTPGAAGRAVVDEVAWEAAIQTI